jgi:hypothetical protein
VVRAISSTALSLLLTVTLFWGGCISCPQFFMFPSVEKNCCNQEGKCERTEKPSQVKECKRMPLEPHGFVSTHAELAAAESEMLPSAPILHAPFPGTCLETAAVEHSPPDLTVLHSTFLI